MVVLESIMWVENTMKPHRFEVLLEPTPQGEQLIFERLHLYVKYRNLAMA